MKIGDPQSAASMALDNISTQVPTKGKIEDSPEAILEAAKAFEAVFLNEIMKSMRKTLPEDGLLNSGFANGVFNSMLDQEYAQIASRSGQVGLSKMIALQLNRGEPIDLDDLPAGDASSSLEARRMSAGHLESARRHAVHGAPASQLRGASSVEGDETVIVDGEEVPAWLFEEVTEERPAEELVLDTWVAPTPAASAVYGAVSGDISSSAPVSEQAKGREPSAEPTLGRAQRRAASAYQRLKR